MASFAAFRLLGRLSGVVAVAVGVDVEVGGRGPTFTLGSFFDAIFSTTSRNDAGHSLDSNSGKNWLAGMLPYNIPSSVSREHAFASFALSPAWNLRYKNISYRNR